MYFFFLLYPGRRGRAVFAGVRILRGCIVNRNFFGRYRADGLCSFWISMLINPFDGPAILILPLVFPSRSDTAIRIDVYNRLFLSTYYVSEIRVDHRLKFRLRPQMFRFKLI